MNKKKPLVYIVIINWNGGEMIEKCISSLKLTSYPNYKLILIDNASEDNSVKKLKKIFPNMEIIILNDNYGCASGRNVSIKTLLKNKKVDYICLMDSDVITIQKDWLDLQIKELEKNKNYGISGGKLIFPDNRLQVIIRNDRSNFEEKDEGQYNFIQETNAVWGACMIIKRSVIEKIGLLDENFFYGPDDVDYCYRAKKKGFKILYNGFSKSIHIGAYSGLSPKKDQIYLHQSYGMMLYSFRHLSLNERIEMPFRQLIRVFITRKDPFSKFSITNTIWHLENIPKRLLFFFISFYKALKNYSKIKETDTISKIIKI
jgi:GT2 family glycosyltransferase